MNNGLATGHEALVEREDRQTYGASLHGPAAALQTQYWEIKRKKPRGGGRSRVVDRDRHPPATASRTQKMCGRGGLIFSNRNQNNQTPPLLAGGGAGQISTASSPRTAAGLTGRFFSVARTFWARPSIRVSNSLVRSIRRGVCANRPAHLFSAPAERQSRAEFFVAKFRVGGGSVDRKDF